MDPRVSLVTLGVADPARARRFYADGHPWEIAGNPGFPLQPDATIRLPD